MFEKKITYIIICYYEIDAQTLFRELYHESHALDRFEQDYKRKLQEEENPSTAQRGNDTKFCHLLHKVKIFFLSNRGLPLVCFDIDLQIISLEY